MDDSLFSARRAAARRAMREHDLDTLIVGPSPAFVYLTGRRAIQTERFVALLLCVDGTEMVIAPRLQAPLYDGMLVSSPVVWDEWQEPVDLLARLLDQVGSRRAACNAEFWSGFLLALRSRRPALALTGGGALLDGLRVCKSAAELASLERAAARIDDVWRVFCETAGSLVGQTELAVRARIDGLMRDAGFSDVAWVDVGAGANGASPLHHGSSHVIQAGEPVVIDYAGCFEGYYGDICRVAATGEVAREYLDLYDIVRTAQETAFQAIRPGVQAQAVDAAARRLLAAHGYGDAFTHRLGHGIGLAAHEEPYIVEGNRTLLREGMVFSDEPGVYVPARWGVRIEDIVAVTADGARRLNQASRDLAYLG